MFIEILGYVASVCIATSMLMSSLLWLRLVNMAGGILMVVYGVAIGALPVIVMNAITVTINAGYLAFLMRRPAFRLLTLDLSSPSAYLRAYLSFYREDLLRFQGDFEFQKLTRPEGFFILRDMVPAGLVIYEVSDGVAWVHLDYVAPPYRDFKNARFAYGAYEEALRARGVTAWRAHGTFSAKHRRYLARLGFVAAEDAPQELVRTI